MKKHRPINNLGKYAHPEKKTTVPVQNFAKPPKAQTRNNTAPLIGKAAKATGKRGKA